MQIQLMKAVRIFLLGLLLMPGPVSAAEEEIQLGASSIETPSMKQNEVLQAPKFSLMGRVDLTSETQAADRGSERKHQLENHHFLIFLKVKASDKTSFMGEIVQKSFYFASYRHLPQLKFDFGKIIVPFGDTRRFHLLYGGLASLNGTGIMLPQVWAESGLNIQSRHFENNEMDAYWVESIQDDSQSKDPDLHASDEPRNHQAGGFRWIHNFLEPWTSILSFYRGEYQSGKAVELAGFNLYSEYGAFGWQKLRWAVGIANAWIHAAPLSGDFQKRGDFLELAKRIEGEQELRFRYGTYVDNDKVQSARDLHSFSVGYSLPVDVSKLLFEYQWNFEAMNEINNDLFRAMLSLDF